jgi:hypothetical protein
MMWILRSGMAGVIVAVIIGVVGWKRGGEEERGMLMPAPTSPIAGAASQT